MLIGALVLAAAALVTTVAQRRYPARVLAAPPRRAAGGGDRTSLFRHPYASVLLLVAVMASLTGILVEFQFYVAAATSGQDARQNATFFANFYLVLNGAALIAQLYLMPRVQRWVGVHGSLLIMPVAILGGAALLTANGSMLARSGLKLTEGGLKASLHRSNWEQAFLPVDERERTSAKLWIDGAAARVAEGVAALALYVWLVAVVGDRSPADVSYAWITYGILGTASAWLLLTRALARRAGDQQRPPADAMRVDLPLPDT
jgi:ATP/ADP translocase